MVPKQDILSDNPRPDDVEEHQNCIEDCEICQEERQRKERRREGEHYARLEAANQSKLWGPGGIFWDPSDSFCQEIAQEMKKTND